MRKQCRRAALSSHLQLLISSIQPPISPSLNCSIILRCIVCLHATKHICACNILEQHVQHKTISKTANLTRSTSKTPTSQLSFVDDVFGSSKPPITRSTSPNPSNTPVHHLPQTQRQEELFQGSTVRV